MQNQINKVSSNYLLFDIWIAAYDATTTHVSNLHANFILTLLKPNHVATYSGLLSMMTAILSPLRYPWL